MRIGVTSFIYLSGSLPTSSIYAKHLFQVLEYRSEQGSPQFLSLDEECGKNYGCPGGTPSPLGVRVRDFWESTSQQTLESESGEVVCSVPSRLCLQYCVVSPLLSALLSSLLRLFLHGALPPSSCTCRAIDLYLVTRLAIQFPASAPDLWETHLQGWPLPVQHQQPSVCTGGRCSSQQRQGTKHQECYPSAWKGNCWEMGRKGLFILTTLSSSFLIIIMYSTKNFAMIDHPGLLFGPSRKEDHVAPGGAPVSWSTEDSLLMLLQQLPSG